MLETLSLYSDDLMIALLEERVVSESEVRALVRGEVGPAGVAVPLGGDTALDRDVMGGVRHQQRSGLGARFGPEDRRFVRQAQLLPLARWGHLGPSLGSIDHPRAALGVFLRQAGKIRRR